jgi:hypothetical protein
MRGRWRRSAGRARIQARLRTLRQCGATAQATTLKGAGADCQDDAPRIGRVSALRRYPVCRTEVVEQLGGRCGKVNNRASSHPRPTNSGLYSQSACATALVYHSPNGEMPHGPCAEAFRCSNVHDSFNCRYLQSSVLPTLPLSGSSPSILPFRKSYTSSKHPMFALATYIHEDIR